MTYQIIIEVKPSLDYSIIVTGVHNLLKAIGALRDAEVIVRRDIRPPPFDALVTGFKLTITSDSPNLEPDINLVGTYTRHEAIGVVRVAAFALERIAADRNQGVQERIKVQ